MEFPIHPLQIAFDQLYKEMNDLYHESAVSMGLSDSAQIVLYTLCELGNGCLQRDICERSFLSKQTIHSAVRKLEQEGLLTLIHGKGRDMHLALTDAGRALAVRTVYPLAAAEYQAMEALSHSDQKELLRLTQAYLSALRRELKSIPYE